VKTVRSVAALRSEIRNAKRRGKTIGFVPTMGALHAGHLKLIQTARRRNDLVVVSLFVNPIQFNNPKDLKSYPRTGQRDRILARAAGADLLFIPSVRALYPDGFQTFVEVTRLSKRWEGAARPGHFQGVATVVAKLFNLVQPTEAYFGRKDAQQARLVRQMVLDLNFPVRVRALGTVRESGGLALSSRNRRLSPGGRRLAGQLHAALQEGRGLIKWGFRRPERVIARMRRRVSSKRIRIEYLAIVDPGTLEPVRRITGPVWLLGAVRIEGVRLIDNLTCSAP